MAAVEAPMRRMTAESTLRRPIRSPKWEKTRPPSGRIVNPRAKTPKVWSMLATGSPGAKNWWEMWVAT